MIRARALAAGGPSGGATHAASAADQAGGAVRMRASTSSSRAQANIMGDDREYLRAPSLFVTRTRALRLQSGGATPWRTSQRAGVWEGWEVAWEAYKPLILHGYSRSFPTSQPSRAHDIRVCARARARLGIIISLGKVGRIDNPYAFSMACGFQTDFPTAFRFGKVGRIGGAMAARRAGRNKIGGGYAALGRDPVAQGPDRGEGRRNFRPGGGRLGGPIAAGDQAGENGGFPPFPGVRCIAVGMAALERQAKSEADQRVAAARPKLRRLIEAPRSIAAGAPPSPPSAAPSSPSMSAHGRAGISFRPWRLSTWTRPETLMLQLGHGVRVYPTRSNPRGTGARVCREARQRAGQWHGSSVETRGGAARPTTLWGGPPHVN